MQISELRPYAKKIDLTVKVLNKGEIREVVAKMDGSQHRVTEALVGDGSGTVMLTLWDEMIDRVEEGKSYKIINGYATTFRGSLRVNVGRYGQLEDSSEEVAEVNEDNNISEREFEERRQF